MFTGRKGHKGRGPAEGAVWAGKHASREGMGRSGWRNGEGVGFKGTPRRQGSALKNAPAPHSGRPPTPAGVGMCMVMVCLLAQPVHARGSTTSGRGPTAGHSWY